MATKADIDVSVPLGTPTFPPEPAPSTVAATVKRARKPIMDATTKTTADAKTIFADATERAKSGLAKGQALAGELGEFGKGNVEALVESSKIAAKGLETLSQSAAAYMRSSLEDAQAQARSLASATSPTEFLKLQGDFMRLSFDKMIAETSRGTEAMLKLAGEVAQPISNRMALAADRIKTAA